MDSQAESVRSHFGQLAVQYFVAGRAAAIHQLIPVLGNLLHHAVEMALKSALASTMSLSQLKKLGHQLPNLWTEFKATLPGNASRFDSTVEELHRFEELRYPDSVIANGALMDLALFREHVGKPVNPSPGPRYVLVLEDVDELMEFIFASADINPRFFKGAMSPSAKDYLSRHNRHATKW
jgi:hypothetical protein